MIGSRRSHSPALALLLLVFLLSLAARWENVWERQLISHNEDATGHVLTTMRAMEAAPPSVHNYLPIATISQGAGDRHSENFHGTSIKDQRGNYYYVSFPPLGFVAPYATLSALGLPMDVVNLRLFSAALGFLSALLLYLLLARVLAGSWLSETRQRTAALLLASLFLLSSESLWIFGNVYWHHVLLQPLLLLSLLALLRVLERPSRGRYLVLGLSLFFSCLAEWSGFLLAGAVGLSGLWLLWKKRAGLGMVVAAAVSGTAGLGAILWHFSLAAGLRPYLEVLATRPGSHVTRPSLIFDLLVVFVPLYLPLLAIAAAFWFARKKGERPAEPGSLQPLAILLFCAAAAAGQSVLLLHHSIWYTYGTLPITSFLLIAMAAMFRLGWGSVKALAIGSALAIPFWGGLYFVQNPPSLNDTEFGRQFRHYEIVRAYPGKDYVAFTNVAGDNSQLEPIYAGRNLIEFPTISKRPTLAELQAYMERRPEAAGGKLFLFAPPGRVSGGLWWPYTKTAPFERDPPLRLGPARAVVSFDRAGLNSVDLHRSAFLEGRINSAAAPQSSMTPEARDLLAGFDLAGASCSEADGRGFHRCAFGTSARGR